jgi:hypothetical protein
MPTQTRRVVKVNEMEAAIDSAVRRMKEECNENIRRSIITYHAMLLPVLLMCPEIKTYIEGQQLLMNTIKEHAREN